MSTVKFLPVKIPFGNGLQTAESHGRRPLSAASRTARSML